MGACVEAYTDDTANCTETDSRLYGCFTVGSAAALTAAFLTGNDFLDHTTGSGSYHGWIYQPGTSSTYACGRAVRMQAVAAAGGEVDQASAHIGLPIPIARSTAANTQNGAALGRLREVYFLGAVQGAQTRRNGATDLFHVIGYNSGAADDAISIKAAP